MKLPKIRLTWGSIASLVLGTAGFLSNHEAIITAIATTTGGKLAAAAVIGLSVSKALVTTNHDSIPDDKKVEAGPLVLEKTGPFKPTI